MFLVKWSERDQFAQEIARAQHPVWGPECAVSDITHQPFSMDQPPSVVMSDPIANDVEYLQNNEFNCLTTCTYSTDFSLAKWPCDIPQPDLGNTGELVMRSRSSMQVLLLPSDFFAYESNTDREKTGKVPPKDGLEGRIFIPTTEYQLQWYYVDEPPIKLWDEGYVGRVNESTFLGAEAETILFEGYDLEPSTQFQITDPFAFTLTLHMRKRRIVDGEEIRGWNHELHREGWERVQMKDSSGEFRNRYLTVDFSSMFILDAGCSSSSSGA